MSTRHNPYSGAKRKTAEPVEDTVPEGTAKEILEWVSEDGDKALEALKEEQNQDKPRKTLIESLKGIVNG